MRESNMQAEAGCTVYVQGLPRVVAALADINWLPQ